MDVPRALALLPCTAVDRGARGGLRLGGLFTEVHGRAFPLLLPRWWLFLRLAGAAGSWNARILVRHEASDETVAEGPVGSFRTETNRPRDLLLDAGALLLPWPGRYRVELVLDGRDLATASFEALRRERRGAPPR